jgi:Tfp pilus assembly protein PilF
VVWAFTSFEQSNWHPVTWLSHMADCQLFGLNPGPHHLTNVFLHAANVLLLFWLLQKATGAVWRSFLVAALFGVHPMNVETVAWVAERKSLLCTLFSLLTIAAYGWYASRPEVNKYLVVVLVFIVALMAKPMAVTLPVVLLLLDYWPLNRYESLPFGREWLRLFTEKLPLLLISAASSAVTVIAQRSGSSLGGLSAVSLSLRMQNAIVSYEAYIGKMFWPAKLAVFYPFPESLPWSEVAGAAVVLVAITAAIFYFRNAQYLVMGWCLFIATLVPVIGVVQVGSQSMADRYAYIPYIGLFIIIAWGTKDVADAVNLSPIVPAVAGLCVILAFAAATTQYVQCWQNGTKLFTQASVVAVRPNTVIEQGLADAALSAGRLDEAYHHAAEACRLKPTFAVCHFNMAQILFSRNQLQDAREQFELAATYASNKELALVSLIYSGAISIQLGDYDGADYVLMSALKIDPNNSQALQLRQLMFNQRSENHR